MFLFFFSFAAVDIKPDEFKLYIQSRSETCKSIKMTLYTLFAILAVFVGTSLSFRLDASVDKNFENNRIIGGSTAGPGQFPYMASLRRYDTVIWRHLCGGSILSNRWILSAASCTFGIYSKPSNLVVVVGAHHIQNGGRIYYLERIVNHPQHNNSIFKNDISLLRTNETIQFNDVIRPIRLRRRFVDAGVASTVSGWGWSQVRKNLLRFFFHFAYRCEEVSASVIFRLQL